MLASIYCLPFVFHVIASESHIGSATRWQFDPSNCRCDGLEHISGLECRSTYCEYWVNNPRSDRVTWLMLFRNVVALTFFRRYKRSDWRFCACAINVTSPICSETTKHLWYKYHGLFVRMYINSQQNYLSQINRGKEVLKHILIV